MREEAHPYQTHRRMGVCPPWTCQRPWCRTRIERRLDCKDCKQVDGRWFQANRERGELPDGHRRIVMVGTSGANAGFAHNPALYAGSDTRPGHVGCTIDVYRSTSSIVIHGGAYPDETYRIHPGSDIFDKFPSDVQGASIDAVEPYEGPRPYPYTITVNGIVMANPKMIRTDERTDIPARPVPSEQPPRPVPSEQPPRPVPSEQPPRLRVAPPVASTRRVRMKTTFLKRLSSITISARTFAELVVCVEHNVTVRGNVSLHWPGGSLFSQEHFDAVHGGEIDLVARFHAAE